MGRHDLGALFDPGRPESIAAAVSSVVSDPLRYAALKQNLAVAKRRYCWEEEEKRFLAIYRSLHPEDPAPAPARVLPPPERTVAAA